MASVYRSVGRPAAAENEEEDYGSGGRCGGRGIVETLEEAGF